MAIGWSASSARAELASFSWPTAPPHPPTTQPEVAAVKILKTMWFADSSQQEVLRTRFRHEVEIWQRLHHPNILAVIDAGVESGLPYIVLQYAGRGTLANQIASAKGPLPLAEVSQYLNQIASALDYAHTNGVIHRDIKPANILLDDAGTAFVCDFSIAKVLEGTQTSLTSTNMVLGTPSFMAPEQVNGTGSVGPAADIYSWACCSINW